MCAISLQHIKKEVSDAVYFLLADKYENLLKSENNIFWWVWSSIPKVLKIASLQCLYNISKNKFIIEFIIVHYSAHYRVHQDQNFYKLDYQFLMEARHVHSTQKRKFLQYINEKYWNCICVLLWGKNIQILYGVPVMFVVICFCKHSNCPDFARTVPVFGIFSQRPRLNRFVPVFIFLTKKCSYLHNFSSAV